MRIEPETVPVAVVQPPPVEVVAAPEAVTAEVPAEPAIEATAAPEEPADEGRTGQAASPAAAAVATPTGTAEPAGGSTAAAVGAVESTGVVETRTHIEILRDVARQAEPVKDVVRRASLTGSGRITIRIRIRPNGEVGAIEAVEADFPLPDEVRREIRRIVSSWRFRELPASSGDQSDFVTLGVMAGD